MAADQYERTTVKLSKEARETLKSMMGTHNKKTESEMIEQIIDWYRTRQEHEPDPKSEPSPAVEQARANRFSELTGQLDRIELQVRNLMENRPEKGGLSTDVEEAVKDQIDTMVRITNLAPKMNSIITLIETAKKNIVEAAVRADEPFRKAVKDLDESGQKAAKKLESAASFYQENSKALEGTVKSVSGASERLGGLVNNLEEKLEKECLSVVSEAGKKAAGQLDLAGKYYKKTIMASAACGIGAILISVGCLVALYRSGDSNADTEKIRTSYSACVGAVRQVQKIACISDKSFGKDLTEEIKNSLQCSIN